MDWFWQLLGLAIGVYVVYVIVVGVVVPAVVFVVTVGVLTVLPTVILLVILMREMPQDSWINRTPAFFAVIVGLAAFVGLLLLAGEYANEARGVQTPSLLRAYALGVYGTAGLYAVYLTGHFGMRTWHYYQLPKLSRAHRDKDGRLDVNRIVADMPNLSDQAKRRAWVSQNQALRAAQALSGLTGSTGVFDHAPRFLDQHSSKWSAAREFVRAYQGYMRGAEDTVIREYIEDNYERRKRELTNDS